MNNERQKVNLKRDIEVDLNILYVKIHYAGEVAKLHGYPEKKKYDICLNREIKRLSSLKNIYPKPSEDK